MSAGGKIFVFWIVCPLILALNLYVAFTNNSPLNAAMAVLIGFQLGRYFEWRR